MFTNRIFFFTFLCFILAINDVVATSDKSVWDLEKQVYLDSLSPNEVIIYMNQGLENVKTKIPQIEHIDQLNELKSGRLGQLENYFNAYSTVLTKEEQSKLLSSIKQVKKELDFRIRTIDLGYGDDVSFKKGMKERLEGIKEEIYNKKKRYNVLKNALERLMVNYEVYMNSNTSVDLSWQKEFKEHYKEVSRILEEEIPEYDNLTKKFTWTWTIKTYKIEKSTARLTRLEKKISKLKNSRCSKKISKLTAKKEFFIADQGKVIDKDIIELHIVLGKKSILTKEGNKKLSYWGIQSVSTLSSEKENDEEGIFTIESEYKLDERLFEDIGTVAFKLRRNAVEIEKAVVMKSEEARIDWSLSLKTNKDEMITLLDISPLSDEKKMLKLGLKDVFWIVCKGDLKEANEKLLGEIRQDLKLKIK